MKIVALGKKPMKKTGLLLAVIASIFFCFMEGRGEDWKEFAEATTGIFYYDKESVKSIPPWVFRVWIHNTNKRETSLIEIDCKEKDYRVLDVVEYSEAGSIIDHHMYYDETVTCIMMTILAGYPLLSERSQSLFTASYAHEEEVNHVVWNLPCRNYFASRGYLSR